MRTTKFHNKTENSDIRLKEIELELDVSEPYNANQSIRQNPSDQ